MKSIRNCQALLFVLLTYCITWGIEIPAALTTYGFAAIPISKGLQTIATFSPGLIALVLTGVYFKKKGLRFLGQAIILWRVKIKWYLVILFLGVVLCGLSLSLFNLMYVQKYHPDDAYNFIFYFLLILPLSALWEEIGWRGFLLPILQKNYTPLKASLIIGFIWGLWHLPIYLALNPYGDSTLIYFFCMLIGCFALSIIETWLYNSTEGSLFICILFHNAVNTSAAFFYGNLKGAEFRPLIIWVFLLTAATVFLCFKSTLRLNRHT